MRILRLLLPLTSFAILAQGCVHDPLTPVYDPMVVFIDPPCNPDTVYFQQDILPILKSACARPDCHDVASAEEDVILISYSHLMGDDEDLVVPGNPYESKLVEVMLAPSDYDVMPPPPNAQLDQSVIDMIILWIEQGALNLSCDGCDTTDVTYGSHIAPLLASRCNTCHGGAEPQADLDLGTIADVTGAISYQDLMACVNSEAGFEPMPPPSGLDACNVRKLEIWIENGMPE